MLRLIGSSALVAGTTIGAGMLALPLASTNFVSAAHVMTGMWILMTLTGLLMARVSIVLEATSMEDVAKKTMNRLGQASVWIVTLFFLCAVMAAYVSMGAELLTAIIHIPQWTSALLLSLVFGGTITCGMKLTDVLNRPLTIAMIAILLGTIIYLLPHVDTSLLFVGEPTYTVNMCSIFLCAFGFHTIVPSLYAYNKDNPKRLYWAVVLGTAIPLLVYAAWLIVTLGIVQGNTTGSTVDGLFIALSERAGGTQIFGFVTVFSLLAIITSFLGMGRSLFDFLHDGLRWQGKNIGRLQTALATFVPPLIFAVWCQDGFLLALRYSAIFATLLMVVFPVVVYTKIHLLKNTPQTLYARAKVEMQILKSWFFTRCL